MLALLADDGFVLTAQHKQIIRIAGFEDAVKKLDFAAEQDPEPVFVNTGEAHLWLYDVPKTKDGKPLEGTCYWDKVPSAWKKKWADREITKDDWKTEKPTRMSREFRRFIDSSNPRFDRLMEYEPFYVYCEQARRWEEETRHLEYQDQTGPEGKLAWVNQEGARMRQNKLYGANRYATIKEDNKGGGRRKFKASAPQALLCFLVDCGYHFSLVKGRQAAITSVMMVIADLEMVFRPSYSGVFVVHKKDGTGKKLFKDKHQSTLQHFPSWITNEIDVSKGFAAERTILDFASAGRKMDKLMDASEFILLSAEDSMVVNGQTPTQTFFDESQNIPTFQALVNEIDPTLYQFNDETGEMELVRGLYAWGTGSSNALGKGSFESHIKGLFEAWGAGEETEAWVPLFFDWTCRPGITREFYEMQRRKYLRGQTEETKGLTQKERLAIFSAHYPSELEDAFMSSHKTLFPADGIKAQKRRIELECHANGWGPKPGRFHPIFNESISIPAGSYWPHPVIGVRWEELSMDDETAPVFMLRDRERNYANRYSQGTDPIQNDGGFSRFSSVIRDRIGVRTENNGQNIDHPIPAVCVLNYRSPFPEEVFIQNILMGMYYANYGQRACPEVLEINAGHKYVDMKCSPIFNLMDSLVLRAALPPLYRGGQHTFGVDLKGGKNSRKEALYHDGTNLLRREGHNLWYYKIWTQIQNINVESKADGSVQWGTVNKNAYNDDMVYAMFYADVCERVYMDKPCVEINVDAPQFETRDVIRMDPQTLEIYHEQEQILVNY